MIRFQILDSPSISCFSVEIDEQIRGLVDANAVQLSPFKFGDKSLPDRNRDVFGGRNAVGNLGTFFVKEAVSMASSTSRCMTSLSCFRSTTKPERGSTL